MNNIISYSLWGTLPMYLKGAIENARTAKQYYPDWKVRFYIDRSVPIEFCKELKNRYDADFYIIENPFGSWHGLFWRFYVADDPTVDRYIIRDCDSRLSHREANAVNEWINSNLPFHGMVDHPWQSGVPILGGMWGAIRGCIPNMKNLIHKWINDNQIIQKGPDQFFLRDMIWPIVKDKCLVHDEVSLPQYRNPKAIPFPTKRDDYRFVGERFNEYNKPSGDAAHPEHWKILKDFLDKN
jgi:hypothetical protein